MKEKQYKKLCKCIRPTLSVIEGEEEFCGSCGGEIREDFLKKYEDPDKSIPENKDHDNT